MKNSLFKKLFITYGITIIISFTILAFLLLQLLNSYLIANKKKLMTDQGMKITSQIVKGFYTGRLEIGKLNNDLQILDKYLDARIWIVDDQGYIIGVSGKNQDNYLGQKIGQEKLDALCNGENIDENGNFEGKLSVPAITIGYPMFYEGIFKGGVLIHASLEEIRKTFEEIYKIIIWSIILSVIMAYIILYFQIKRISNPLKEINEAAKIISGGEFQKRLKIDTGDEIQELADSFNHMAESLEKIEENRRNFIANISHDLRSPMTSISGFVQGILDGTIPDEKHGHYMCIVLEECRRLMKMTNDLLELSNMQQGQTIVSKTDFELNESIRRVLVGFERQITSKNLKVDLSLFDEFTKVYSDKQFVERIMTNLIDNAVKFTPKDGSIKISTFDDKDRVKIAILNTGASIDEALLKKIWERFHKGDTSRGQYKNGFGLGLSIVKEIISQLDEKIWVESGENFVKFSFSIVKSK